MTPTRQRLVGAALAVLVAVVLVLVAVDVLRWRAHLDDAALGLAARPEAEQRWEPDTILPTGVSKTLLGLDDDVALRRAAERFWQSRPRRLIQAPADVTRRSGAESELARAAREGGPRDQRAVLSNLRGVLALEEARSVQLEAPVLLRRAAANFRQAVLLDRDYEDAKFNLELALKLLRGQPQSGGGGGERTGTPASGAGAASAGRGY